EVLPRAGHAAHLRLTAELAFRAHFPCDTRHFRRKRPKLIDHRVDRVLELEDFAFDIDGDLLREVAVGDGSSDLGDVADLRSQVAGHEVYIVRQVFPGPGHALYF